MNRALDDAQGPGGIRTAGSDYLRVIVKGDDGARPTTRDLTPSFQPAFHISTRLRHSWTDSPVCAGMAAERR